MRYSCIRLLLRLAAKLEGPERTEYYLALRKLYYLTPPYPEPRADNSFNLVRHPH